MKVTACFNVMFDVEVPEEIVDKARDVRPIEKTELFKMISDTPEFKQIFSENVDGEVTGIYTPYKEDPFFDDVIWED